MMSVRACFQTIQCPARSSLRMMRGAYCTRLLLPDASKSLVTTSAHFRYGSRGFASPPSFEVSSPLRPELPNPISMHEQVLQTALRFPNNIAMECGLTGESFTYGELVDRSLRLGSFFLHQGITKGDVVAIMMPNVPDYPVVFCATHAIGAVVSPINATFTPGEVARQLVDSGSVAVVVHPLLEEAVVAAVGTLKHQIKVFVTGENDNGLPDLTQAMQDKNIPFCDVFTPGPDDLSVLPYSSGTTGLPKGVCITDGAVRANMGMVLNDQIWPYIPTTASSQETVMGLMPFFHAYGMYAVMACSLAHGAKIVTLPKFFPELFLDIIRDHKVGVLHLVPSLLLFLVGNPLVKPEDLASVRVAMCSAAPVPAPAAEALKIKAPNKDLLFQEVYGMTETMPSHWTPAAGGPIGSSGVLLPNAKAKVVNLEDGSLLGPDQPGELWTKTPSVMSRYHNNEAATVETLPGDGWLRTGDVAQYDEQGNFYIVDRLKELIKVKGSQVSPSELEAELLKHPGVGEVGVVGVPDDRAGELPRAYVVRRDPAVTEQQLVEFMANKVAPHKRLAAGVRFVESLPRNETGKLIRKTMKEMAMQD